MVGVFGGGLAVRGACRSTCGLPVVALVGMLIMPSARAEDHVVRTRRTEWIPTVLFIQPGDTVIWEEMRGHETALVDGMGPPGAQSWDSMLDAEGFRITLTQEGAYIYTCDIHINGGMVGAIVVGNGVPSNLDAIDAALPRVEVGRVFVERIIARMKREIARRH